MRFDTPIYFRRVIAGAYDADSGDYASDDVEEVKRFASVTNSGTDTMRLIYGELKQGAVTVRIQGRYIEPFDSIRIGERIYKADMVRELPRLQTFVLSEVQKNAET